METISYAVLVKDEVEEISRLIKLLSQYKNGDEIVVVQDISTETENTKKVKEVLTNLILTSKITDLSWYKFDGDYSNIKNFLISKCVNNWIFNIDADEYPDVSLLDSLHSILESNSGVELFWVPRINIVKGLTEQHIKEWRWVMSNIEGVADEQVVNFPDYQCRIFRNNKQIKWKYRVHEVIIGNTNYVQLPPEREFALWHIKDIQRQVFQNEYYKTIKRIE